MNLNSESKLILEHYLDDRQRKEFSRLFSDKLLLSEEDFKSKVKTIVKDDSFIGPKGDRGDVGPKGDDGKSVDVNKIVTDIISQLKSDNVFVESIIEKAASANSWWYSGSGINETDAKEIALSQIKSGRISGSIRISESPSTVDFYQYIHFVDTDNSVIVLNLIEGIDGRQFRILNCGNCGNWVEIVPRGSDLLFGENQSFILYDGEVIELCFNSIEGWR